MTIRGQDVYGHSNPVTGIYDGIIGDLQSNRSDYCSMLVPIETFPPGREIPVDIGPVIQSDTHYILSTPDYHPSSTNLDVKDSFKIISWQVAVIYLLIFCLIHLIAIKIYPKMFWREIQWKRFRKVLKERNTFSLIRQVLSQGSNLESLSLWNQVVFLLIFEVSMALLLVHFKNMMSTEMVVYNKPKNIMSLEDLLVADQKVTFPAASGIQCPMSASSLKAASLERSIVED